MSTETTPKDLVMAVEKISGLPMQTLATVLVQSGYFRDLKSISQAVVKIVAGRELGLGPIESLRGIYVREGQIGLLAQVIASKLRQSGRYDYKLLTCDEKTCEIEFYRVKNGGMVSEGTARYTLTEANQAGLVREGSGWQKNPSDMLFARAFTRGQRRYAPDVFNVTVYSVEELRDIPETGEPEPEAGTDMMPRRKGELPAQGEAPKGSVTPPDSGVEDARQPLGSSTPAGGTNPAGAATEVLLPDPWAEMRELWEPGQVFPASEHLHAAIAAKTEQEKQVADALLAPGALTFELNGNPVVTAGITKETILKAFKLGALADEVAGKGTAKNLLGAEYGVEHRQELTEPQGKAYVAAMTKIINAGQEKRRGK